MAENYIGTIILFAPPNFNLKGYLPCNGQILAISQNQALFALLGTTYGGNGQTTFGIPDLRSRVPVGTGTGTGGLSPYAAGQMGGSESVTLTQQQMPLHNHNVNVTNGAATSASPAGNYLATVGSRGGGADIYATSVATPATLNTSTISLTGGTQGHANIQPYLGMNYFICVQGLFPVRN